MPRSVNHIDVSRILYNDRLNFHAMCERVVEKISYSEWFRSSVELRILVRQLANTDSSEEFDGVWTQILNLAGRDGIVIKTTGGWSES